MRIGFNPANVWQPGGRGFSMGLASDNGVLVHLTGQVAWDENEQIVGLGDVSLQTRQCFKNIEIMLQAVGGTLADLVSVTTYFMDRTHLPIIQKVRHEFLDFPNPPASTSVMVAGLGHEDFLIELTPTAIVPTDRCTKPN